MIIIGYQGIGKSSLAGVKNNNFIDLESGNFWYEKEGIMIRDENWYIPYCKIAEHLSSQGYNVFVSSHKVVRDELKKSKEHVIAICPSIDLKDKWINKLERRYKDTGLEKDFKALANAEARYEDNIKEIIDDIGEKNTLTIKSMIYDLEDIIENYILQINGLGEDNIDNN